ncbi:MAG: glycosyltransferase family 2 protein, partial [Anaerolineae bacterium]
IDWCWRIRSAGYRCLFVPKAKVWHKISASFEEGNRGPSWQYYYWRNRLLFLERHYGLKKMIHFFLRTHLKELAELIRIAYDFKTPTQQSRRHKAALCGVRDYFLRKFGSR